MTIMRYVVASVVNKYIDSRFLGPLPSISSYGTCGDIRSVCAHY